MAEHNVTLELYYGGAWHPAPVYTRDGLTIMRGAATPAAQLPPGSAEPTIANDTGDYSPRNVAGALYGLLVQNLPARVSAGGDVRITGEVALWNPQRAIGGDAWTETQIAGVLQRIGRGTDPIDSALRRYIEDTSPIGYWPMEDDSRFTGLGSADIDQTAEAAAPEWGAFDGPPGSRKTAKFFVNDDRAPSTQTTATAVGTSTDWTVSMWFRAHPGPESSFFVAPVVDFAEIEVAGGTAVRYWALEALSNPPTQFEVSAYSLDESRSLSTPFLNATVSGINVHDGNWHMITLNVYQAGGSVFADLTVDDQVSSQASDSDTFTNGTFARAYLPKREDAANIQDLSLAHLVAWDLNGFSSVDIAARYNAGMGYAGETADDRFIRLCAEEGIAASIVGTADDTVLMGPQLPATLLEQFAEIERTDDATIYEDRDSTALVMRTGASKLNQAPDLTLYYDGGQIAPGLKPVVGDEHIRNDVTASSPKGGLRRVQQLTGPRNVQAPGTDPQGVGRYPTRIDVNPETDDALSDAAGWRVSHGTYDGTWYAAITVDLDAAPYLATLAAAVDIGDCIRLASLPVDEALDAVDHIVIGIKEDLPPKRRTITFYCVPAEPYRVGVLAETAGDVGDFLGHAETDGATTNGATAAGAATFSVATPSGPLWTTDADDFPFDVVVGGQRVSISSISGASSPQTFTVQVGGLPIVYPIPAGSAVTVQQPIIPSL